MAILTGPLLSFGASGKLGDLLVFGKWKGIDVARSYVVPANPNTAAQSTQRGYMTGAVDEWHTAGAPALEGNDKSAWDRFAGVLGPMSGFNAFTKEWMTEKVAGGTPPGHFFNNDVTVTGAAIFEVDVDGDGLATENVTIHLGNSKTFFPVTETNAAIAGNAAFGPLDTTFAAGTRIYYYYTVGTPGTDYMRSGMYSGITT